MRLSEVASFGIGKVLIGIIILLSGALIALGFYTLTVTGERNVLNQTVKTKDAEIVGKVKDVAFMKAWMARDKLDNIAKDEEFSRKMATKPAFRTKIEYVPTGNNCVDLNAIIDEARGNKNTEGTQQ
ncbi:MAG: hypothetical protein JZU49_02750 [Sulfuricurvum sp.]|nr:hypothetical protein [Sulfuricurvum sp.]